MSLTSTPSCSTKTRIVYDASSKRKGPSFLNDCIKSILHLLPQLLKTVLRFCANKFGIISDITQALLYVSIQQSGRDFLRFLWLKDIQNKPLIALRFTCALFGSTSSQFLLASVI